MPAEKAKPQANLYLVLYNAVSMFAWGYTLFLSIQHYVLGRNPEDLYKVIENPLKIAQTMAVMEIIHAMVGLVRSPVFTTAAQVYSRLFIVWMILNLEDTVKYTRSQSYAVFTLMLAWGITEIIRYAFYALKQYDACPNFITVLRYTTFIVLYPLGVSSELFCTFFKLPYIYEHRPYSITLPNSYNFALDTFYVVVFTVIMYIPVFPMLYSYMWTQRKSTFKKMAEDAKQKSN